MSEKKKPEIPEAKFVEPTPAAESSDGWVHQLIAERQTAYLNGDVQTADEITAELAKLGLK